MLRRSILALFCALLLVGAARAEGLKLSLEPLMGSISRGAWQPLTVTATNPPDAPDLHGEFQLQLSDTSRQYGSLGTWTYPVVVGTGERVSVTLLVFVPPGALPSAEVSYVTSKDRVRVASKTFDRLRLRADNTRLLLSLSADPNRLDMLRDLDIPAKVFEGQYGANNKFYHLQSKSLTPAELPDEDLALDGVLGVFIDASTALTPKQKARLDKYVAGGGLLIQSGSVKKLTPDGLGLRAALPDRDFSGWMEVLRYHRMSVVRRLARTTASGDDGYSALHRSVVVGEGLQPLPLSWLLLFLGTYLLILIPVQYAVLKKLGKREWAWGVTPALAILFAVGAYQTGKRGRSAEAFVNVASVVEASSGSGVGRAITRVGLFSPTYRSYDINVTADGPTQLWPQGQSRGAVEVGPELSTIQGMSVPMWSIAQATAFSEVELGGGLEVTPAGKQAYTLTNRTDRMLRRLRITDGTGRCADLTTLGRDQSITVTLGQGYSDGQIFTPTYAYDNQGRLSPKERIRERLTSQLAGSINVQPNNGVALGRVTAWMDESPATVHIDGVAQHPRHQGTALIVRFSR